MNTRLRFVVALFAFLLLLTGCRSRRYHQALSRGHRQYAAEKRQCFILELKHDINKVVDESAAAADCAEPVVKAAVNSRPGCKLAEIEQKVFSGKATKQKSAPAENRRVSELEILAFMKVVKPQYFRKVQKMQHGSGKKYRGAMKIWRKKLQQHKRNYQLKTSGLRRKYRKLKSEKFLQDLYAVVRKELQLQAQISQALLDFRMEKYRHALQLHKKRQRSKKIMIKRKMKYLLRDTDLDW